MTSGGGVASAAVAHGRERALQRLGHHHHARPAAVGPVVDAAIVVVGEIAQRPQAHVDLLRLERAAASRPRAGDGANSSGNSVMTSKRIGAARVAAQ